MDINLLNQALDRTHAALLAQRNAEGYWEGSLSSSALSTATALIALTLFQRHTHSDSPLITPGIKWLLQHQNSDGGWGDTDRSLSNISTTALVWSALSYHELPGIPYAQQQAEAYLTAHAGSCSPTALASAITARYGTDHTFSVPILTICALAGKLGPAPDCWQLVPNLPFELAAVPRSWYRHIGLPVVSYALPALIALGQLKHYSAPPKNPFTRTLRKLTLQKTSQLLAKIQPSSGGYLEATPLTSFVTIALLAMNQFDHPVISPALTFLQSSARPDGSWPIDTHLATWVTTLAINAHDEWPAPDAAQFKQYLLRSQYREIHPFTLAAPGGWAWTHLPGGVPDADDTAGALLALRYLDTVDEPTAQAAAHGLRWLIDLQNTDGGLPTFCRGWGKLPFDRSSPDITAHGLRAALHWLDLTPTTYQPTLRRFSGGCVTYLARTQQSDGSWLPLWFGNQYDPRENNAIYGTARVLRALEEANVLAPKDSGILRMHKAGVHFLLKSQHPNGSWGGTTSDHASIEETALALDALATTIHKHTLQTGPQIHPALEAGFNYLQAKINRVEGASQPPQPDPSPIGFYFAKLWYYEALYPLIFAHSAFSRIRHYFNSDH